jgi:hypothetical protein
MLCSKSSRRCFLHHLPLPASLPHLPQRFYADCGEDVSIEQHPQMQGRQMTMILGPKKETQ